MRSVLVAGQQDVRPTVFDASPHLSRFVLAVLVSAAMGRKNQLPASSMTTIRQRRELMAENVGAEVATLGSVAAIDAAFRDFGAGLISDHGSMAG